MGKKLPMNADFEIAPNQQITPARKRTVRKTAASQPSRMNTRSQK